MNHPGENGSISECHGNFSAYGPSPGQALVADREADIYPSWATVPDTNFHMLGRAMKDRLLAGGAHCPPSRQRSQRWGGAR